MLRFYFHTENGKSFTDDVGTELPDLDAARSEALKVIGQVAADNPADFWAHQTLKLFVADHSGMILVTLELTGADATSTRQAQTYDAAPGPVGPLHITRELSLGEQHRLGLVGANSAAWSA